MKKVQKNAAEREIFKVILIGKQSQSKSGTTAIDDLCSCPTKPVKIEWVTNVWASSTRVSEWLVGRRGVIGNSEQESD